MMQTPSKHTSGQDDNHIPNRIYILQSSTFRDNIGVLENTDCLSRYCLGTNIDNYNCWYQLDTSIDNYTSMYQPERSIDTQAQMDFSINNRDFMAIEVAQEEQLDFRSNRRDFMTIEEAKHHLIKLDQVLLQYYQPRFANMDERLLQYYFHLLLKTFLRFQELVLCRSYFCKLSLCSLWYFEKLQQQSKVQKRVLYPLRRKPHRVAYYKFQRCLLYVKMNVLQQK
eukprot:TRINITY_DN1491_c1_g1_i5.p2 TRINITY_DN1491_c1_g1~~TRINITY_DN1491_c1_g1_i5.p2  ORF type:complete len:225 (-),score=-1.19 TRINITY_DN1491_c1_g1_i5:57-731(-)